MPKLVDATSGLEQVEPSRWDRAPNFFNTPVAKLKVDSTPQLPKKRNPIPGAEPGGRAGGLRLQLLAIWETIARWRKRSKEPAQHSAESAPTAVSSRKVGDYLRRLALNEDAIQQSWHPRPAKTRKLDPRIAPPSKGEKARNCRPRRLLGVHSTGNSVPAN